MKVVFPIQLKLTDDADNIKDLVPNPLIEVGKADLTEHLHAEFSLAAGAVNVQQQFGQVDNAKILLIVTTADITVKINSNSADAITIKADKISGIKKYGFFAGTFDGITALYFGNSGSSQAEVEIFLAS